MAGAVEDARPPFVWWSCSPNTGNGNNVYNTTATGTQNNNNANNAYGIAPDYAGGRN